MDPAHIHLLINHLPILGAFLALPLLGLALLAPRDRGALRAAVLVLTLAGAGGGIALVTGEPAEERVEGLPGTSEADLEVHEERAEVAAILAGLAAVGGLGVAFVAERKGEASRAAIAGLLVAASISAGAMGWTGAAGGRIRHPELRGDAAAVAEGR